jgi:uncharacterized membrane protein YccC
VGPAREAVAACHLRLAEYARALADVARAPSGATRRLHDLPGTWHPRVRTALEQARAIVLATRRSRLGASRRADDVVLALAHADELFSALVASTDELDALLGAPDVAAPVRDAAAGVLDALAAALAGVADALPSGHAAGARPAALDALDAAVMRLWVAVEPSPLHAVAPPRRTRRRPHRAPRRSSRRCSSGRRRSPRRRRRAPRRSPAAPMPSRCRGHARRRDRGVGGGAGAGRRAPGVLREAAPRGRRRARRPAAPARALRAAPRLTVVAAHLLARALHVSRGLWVVTTVLIVLQPSAGLTRRRGAERLVGTLAGGVAAAVLAAVLHTRLALAATMFPLAVLAVALRPVHYGLFTFFLTPVFVLLAEPAVGDWRLAAERILDTLLAGALALVASRALWPVYEHGALAGTLADAVGASRDYVQAAVRAARDEAAPDALSRARRRAGLASSAAEAAVERLLHEPRGRWRDDEALLALLAHVRRVNGAATALAAAHPPPSPPDAALADTVLGALTRCARRSPTSGPPALAAPAPSGPSSAVPSGDASHLVLARVARHARGRARRRGAPAGRARGVTAARAAR